MGAWNSTIGERTLSECSSTSSDDAIYVTDTSPSEQEDQTSASHDASEAESSVATVHTSLMHQVDCVTSQAAASRKRERLLDQQAKLCIRLAEAVRKIKAQQNLDLQSAFFRGSDSEMAKYVLLETIIREQHSASRASALPQETPMLLKKALEEQTRECLRHTKALEELKKQLEALETRINAMASSTDFLTKRQRLEDTPQPEDVTSRVITDAVRGLDAVTALLDSLIAEGHLESQLVPCSDHLRHIRTALSDMTAAATTATLDRSEDLPTRRLPSLELVETHTPVPFKWTRPKDSTPSTSASSIFPSSSLSQTVTLTPPDVILEGDAC